MATTTAWQHDPKSWATTSESLQAALIRRDWALPTHPGDEDEVDRMAGGLVSYIRAKGTTNHQPFQKGYGEALVRQCTPLRDAFHRIIVDQWKHKGKIGHYELYAALTMGDQDPQMLLPTLQEIHTLLQTWNNEGWCPWTPALWMRILWLGRDRLDTSAALVHQLEHIEQHLDENGQFQDREPFCLMHAVGQMDLPQAAALRQPFTDALVSHQQSDGGWGDFSYIACTLIHRWR